MITPNAAQLSFPRNILLIRKGGIITSSYVLCSDYTEPQQGNVVYRAGDIDVSKAQHITFWGDMTFGSTPGTSFEIKPVFVPEPRGNANVIAGAHVGDNIYIGNLASTQASGWTVVTTVTGSTFAEWMVGKLLHITSGVNFTAGLYTIIGFTSATSITIDRACGTIADATAGIGGVAVEFQECSISSASGITAVTPHIYSLTAASISGGAADAKDGGRICWTAPAPACKIMRVYVKGTGTLTVSSLVLGVTFIPPNGA